MIIDKVKPYWTKEEEERLERLRLHRIDFIKVTRAKYPNIEDAPQEALDYLPSIDGRAMDLIEEVQDRYIEDRNVNGLLEDTKEIVEAITREDFLEHINERKRHVVSLIEDGVEEEHLADLRELAKENYSNCYSFFLYHLRVQLKGLKENPSGTDKIIAIIEKKVSKWYGKPQDTYFAMAHGKATDAFAFMDGKDAEIDDITKGAVINKFGVQLFIMKLEELQGRKGINTDKLLSTAFGAFTKQNDFRHLNGKEPDRHVKIPLKWYASQLGYDVEEHPKSTPEAEEREKKRAKNQLDNARKAIRRDLNIIQASALTWEESIKGETKDFDRVSLVTRTAIKNGQIIISLSPEISLYLSQKNLITQYPTKLLRIPAKSANAYFIGRKLHEHYNMDNNQIKGTHDRISISKLLAVTNLASYEEVQKKDRGHWVERIKEPLEKALDTLTEYGVLKDWEYTHAKGVALTEEEHSNINTYEFFADLYLHFTPTDIIDHTDRIEANREAREKKEKRKKKG